MDEVPDLRMFGARLVQGVLALVLGFPSGFAVAMVLPHGEGREASHFAPAFLIAAMGIALAVAWYALFDLLRRRGSRAPVPRASPLPVARVLRCHSRKG
jgi:hypothetical protein